MEVSYNYSYDPNGNLATKTEHPSGNVTTYDYDYENRLISAQNVAQGFSLGFVYDGDKRRISRTATDGTVTKFFYDGINILKDYDNTGAELASYVQGVGIDSLISRKDTNGARYFHADALGSTRTMTDSTESPTATYEYDAWGKITAQTGETANEYKFTARRFEEDIGLQYNRARFYDLEIGRFTTPDPLTGGPDDPTISYQSTIYVLVDRIIKEFFDSLDPTKHRNRYVYCSNNPINLIDPLGLQEEEKKTEEKPQDSVEAEKSEKSQDQQKVEEAKKTWTDIVNQNSKLSSDEKKAWIDKINSFESAKDLHNFAGDNFYKITGKEDIGLIDGSSVIRDALNKIVNVFGGGLGKFGQEAHKAATGQPHNLEKVTNAFVKEEAVRAIKDAITGGSGRSGKQPRLKELGDDQKVSSSDRGWIKQERHQIQRGERQRIRVPPGKNLAHRRGFEAKKGFSYKHSDIQDKDLHTLQHKYEGY